MKKIIIAICVFIQINSTAQTAKTTTVNPAVAGVTKANSNNVITYFNGITDYLNNSYATYEYADQIMDDIVDKYQKGHHQYFADETNFTEPIPGNEIATKKAAAGIAPSDKIIFENAVKKLATTNDLMIKAFNRLREYDGKKLYETDKGKEGLELGKKIEDLQNTFYTEAGKIRLAQDPYEQRLFELSIEGHPLKTVLISMHKGQNLAKKLHRFIKEKNITNEGKSDFNNLYAEIDNLIKENVEKDNTKYEKILASPLAVNAYYASLKEYADEAKELYSKLLSKEDFTTENTESYKMKLGNLTIDYNAVIEQIN